LLEITAVGRQQQGPVDESDGGNLEVHRAEPDFGSAKVVELVGCAVVKEEHGEGSKVVKKASQFVVANDLAPRLPLPGNRRRQPRICSSTEIIEMATTSSGGCERSLSLSRTPRSLSVYFNRVR
jgi:hypothetical protein